MKIDNALQVPPGTGELIIKVAPKIGSIGSCIPPLPAGLQSSSGEFGP